MDYTMFNSVAFNKTDRGICTFYKFTIGYTNEMANYNGNFFVDIRFLSWIIGKDFYSIANDNIMRSQWINLCELNLTIRFIKPKVKGIDKLN